MQYEIVTIDNTKPITYYRLKGQDGTLLYKTKTDMREMISNGYSIIGVSIEDNRININTDNISDVTYANELHLPESFRGYILAYKGKGLRSWAETHEATELKERDASDAIYKFMTRTRLNATVFILHGIRRTGKTTSIVHTILRLLKSGVDDNRICYISVGKNRENSTMYDIYDYIRQNTDIRYLFIDEISYIKDFESTCQPLADAYAQFMNITITGTDSYVFPLATKSGLFSRNIMTHSTYISYKEYTNLMGITNPEIAIQTNMKFGGVLRKSDYDSVMGVYATFQSAIITNIANSIENCGYKDRLGINIDTSQMTYLLYKAILMAVSPRKEKAIYGYDRKLNGAILNALKDMANISEQELTKSNYESIDTTSKYNFLRALDELDLITIVRNAVMPYDNVDRETDIELVCNIQGVAYTMLGSKASDSQLKGSAFENMIISNVIMWAKDISKRGQYIAGYLKYRKDGKEHEIDLVVRNRETYNAVLIEIKYADQFSRSFVKHLSDESLSDLESIHQTRKIIVYRGETMQSNNIHLINAHDFLMNLDTYLMI